MSGKKDSNSVIDFLRGKAEQSSQKSGYKNIVEPFNSAANTLSEDELQAETSKDVVSPAMADFLHKSSGERISEQFNKDEIKREIEEQKMLQPNDELEEAVKQTMADDEKFLQFKKDKEKVAELEAKNPIKSANKNSTLFDSAGLNIFAPIYWLGDKLFSDGTGMSKPEYEEYKTLNKKQIQDITPTLKVLREKYANNLPDKHYKLQTAIEKERQILTQQNAEVKDMSFLDVMAGSAKGAKQMLSMFFGDTTFEDVNGSLKESDALKIAIRYDEENLKRIDDYLTGKNNVWDGLLNHKRDLGTIGIASTVEDFVTSKVAEKVDKVGWEGLSLHEQELLKSYARKQEVEGMDLMEGRGWYKAADGTGASLVFMEGMAMTSGIGGLAKQGAKQGVKALIKKTISNTSGKSLGKRIALSTLKKSNGALSSTAEVTASALLSPSTYAGYNRKMIGTTEIVKDKDGKEMILVRDSMYKSFLKDYELNKDYLEKEKAKFTSKEEITEEDQAAIDEIDGMLENLSEELSMLAPKSKGEAFTYGITETMKEYASEKFVGDYGSKLANKLADSKVGKFISSSKLARPFKYINEKAVTGRHMFNNSLAGRISNKAMYHTGVANMYNGVPGELLEEIVVQATPTFQEDYGKQLEELTNPSFYADVVAQTLLMGGAVTSLGVIGQLSNYRQNKKFYDARASIRDTYKKIDNAISDDNLAETIVMSTGGTGFNIADYNHKIHTLRKEGKTKEADSLEQKKFYNLALNAIRTNTIDEFERALNNAKSNERLSNETKVNIELAKENISQLKTVYEKYQDKPNIGNIISLASQKITNKQSLKEMDVELAKLTAPAHEEIDAFIKREKLDVDFTMSTLMDREFEDPAEAAKYDNFLDKLQAENNTAVDTFINMQIAKNNLQMAHYETMKQFNEQTHPAYTQNLENERVVHEAYNDVLSQVENGNIFVPNAEYNYNNKVKITPEIIDETVDVLKRQYQGVVADNVFEQIRTKQKQILENKIQSEKQAHLTAEQEAILQKRANEMQGGNDAVNKPIVIIDDISEDGFATSINDTVNNVVFATQDVLFEIDDEFDEMLGGESYSKEQLDALKRNVKVAVENIESKLGRKPTFRETMEQMYKYTQDKDSLKKIFTHIVKGWQENNYTPDNYQEVYNDLFNPFEEGTALLRDSILNMFETEYPAQPKSQFEEVESKTEDIQRQIGTSNSSIVAYDEENMAVVKSDVEAIETQRTVNILPKLGFAAIPYTEEIVDGVYVRKSKGSTLNLSPDSLIDFRSLLNPDTYKSGDKLGVEIAPEDLWSQISVYDGRNTKGESQTTSFAQWVKDKESTNPDFRNTQEFKNKVPIFFTDKAGNRLAYVHDVDWYNPFNVANPFGESSNPNLPSAKWMEHIEEGKRMTENLRNNIHRGLQEVTIEKPEEGVFHVIPEEEPYITLTESNPQSQVAVQRGEELFIGNVPFSAGILLNKNEKKVRGKFDIVTKDGINQNGHTWVINRIGFATNDKGEQVPSYRAFPVLRKVAPEQIETTRWALAAHMTLKGFNREIKGTPYDMTIDQAKQIQRAINSNMNYNIEDHKQAINFIKSFYQLKLQGDNISAYRTALFSGQDITEQISQHTNSALLGSNHKSIVHIEKGIVKPLNKGYEQYLKDTLYTNIKAFDVDTTGKKPVYATVIQPVINVTFQEVKEQVVAPTAREIAAQEVLEEIQQEQIPFNIDRHIEFLDEIGVDFNTFNEEDFLIENVDKLANIFNTIKGLNIAQEKAVRQYIVHNIGEKVSFEYKTKISEAKLRAEIKSELGLITRGIKGKAELMLKEIEKQDSTDPRIAPIIEAYKATLNNINSIEKNFNDIFDKAFKDIQKQTQLSVNEAQEAEMNEDEVSLSVKNYNADSIEESGKSKASYRLRRFLHKIPKYNADGTVKKTYLGITDYMSFNDVYNELSKVLAMGSDVVSDYKFIMNKLKQSESPFVKDVLAKLDGADQQIKNEFVYNFTRHSLSSKFAMYETNKNGTTLKIYDTNSNEAVRTISKKWKNENKASNLYNKDLTFNVNYAEAMLAEYNEWSKDYAEVPQADLRNWLGKVGIAFEDAAWNEIYEKGIFNAQKQNSFSVLYNQASGGLFKPIVKFLTAGIANPAAFEYGTDINVFADLSGVMKALALVEAKYNPNLIALSFRDSGKNISTQVPTKYVTDMVQNLKRSLSEEGNNLIDDLQSLSYSQDSIILNLLRNEPSFRNIFELSHLGLTAVKEKGGNRSNASITELGEIDYDLAVLAGFTDRKVDKLPETTKINGVSLRVANMMFPTMSDKTTGLYLKTAVFDFLKDSSLLFTNDPVSGELVYGPEVKELLVQQLVLPELKRIIKFHQQVGNTNIKNYDNGAMMFHLIPKLNTIKDNQGVNLLEKLATFEDYTVEDILEQYGEAFENAVVDVVKTEVKHKMTLWGKYNEKNREGLEYSKMFDTKYFSEVDKNPAKDYELAVHDFVLNSLLFNSEVFKVFAGDIANYSQDKLFKENGKEIAPYQAKNADTYVSINKSIGVNLGKRLALLIAPGNKIANSYNEKYNQIFLQDAVDISANSEYLIKNYYGEEALKKATPILESIKNNADELNQHEQGAATLTPDRVNELKISLANSRNDLAKMYPDLDAYFDIESTDAQEYTTANEHVATLHRMGRISDTEFNTIATKLLTDGPKGYLTKEELSLVLQPIKPVHTGSYINKDYDINRVVYVKSSSFPLIPQLTAGTKLDALRLKMEELETKTGRFTRASFQTANKVGATKKTINPFDVNSLEGIKEYADNDVNSKVLILNRDNFRIQQDVPFKSDKKQDDKVSMGTQFFKLLFGDGMIDVQDYQLNGKTVTGEQLYAHFNQAFKDIVDSKKQELFLDLGLSDSGRIQNEDIFVKKLQDLLIKEATGRGYSIKSLAGLKIEQLSAKAGYYYEFKTPLWLSPDSNKYESLLNSIITNRIMKHKLPGNGFVAGSESGFRFKEGLEGIEKSRIIFLDSWNGEELQGVHTTNVDGEIKFNKAQVFVPSKFKNHKKELIDLFEGFNGKEGKYIYRRENGTLGLIEGMIDPELLNNFSFRTPTSSHVSGSTIEIAGILPPESGDLMIVPKNFTKQKGLDYDIDKESAYQLNHYLTDSGRIEVLSEVHVEEATKGLKDMIAKYEQQNETLEKKHQLFTRLAEMHGGLFDEEGLEELKNPQISVREKLTRVELQFKRKLAENEFIKTHLAVFNNPNPEVQSKINKILSIDFAKDQAEKFEKLNQEGEKNKIIEGYINDGYSPAEAADKYNADNLNFTMLTYSYQKNKMSLGSIGKVAIGVYANYTTFNGLLQQNKKGSVFIKDADGEAKHLTIGKFTSNGVLGLDKTLSPAGATNDWFTNHQRTTAEVFAEKENTATDNEKEQVLGRVGVNEFTINVDSHMTLRGFDKDENGNSISYLLLSQPIIKELNARRKDGKGILGKYQKDNEIINELIAEIAGDDTVLVDGELYTKKEVSGVEQLTLSSLDTSILTGDALLEGIEFNGRDTMVQLNALVTYLQLEEEAKAVSKLQKTINVNVLGKSMIEAQVKYNGLVEMANNKTVANAHVLLGDFLDEQGNRNDGVWIGDKYVVPTTPQGQIVINGLHLGNTLYKDFFPYQDKSILGTVKEILSAQDKEDVSDNVLIDNFETIIEDMKKYLYSRKGNNVFNVNPRVKRYELFVDDAVNVSLASYLKNTLRDENVKFRKGIKSLAQNTLVKSFNFEIGKGENELSLIKYNNAATDNLDEEDLYNSIPEMILNNHPLPDRNGKPYTTRQLAEDLVSYTFLEGGVQEATQFVKFIPIEYLESVGQYEDVKSYENGEIVEKKVFIPANRKLQAFNSKKNSQVDIFATALGVREEQASLFTKQYFQHHPEKATKLFKPKRVNKDVILHVVENGAQPSFVSVKNPKTDAKKYSLFEHVGNGTYNRIDTLGDMGISEYEYRNENVVALNNDYVSVATPLPTNNGQLGANNLNVTEETTFDDLLGQIASTKLADEYKHLSEAAGWLKPMLKKEGKIILDENLPGAGRATKATLNITMNPKYTTDISDEATAMTFVHEVIHTLSRNELDKYFTPDGTQLKEGIQAPKHVLDLFLVFNEFRSKMKPELDTLLLKMSGKADPSLGTEYTDREKGLVYAAKNIREFLAVALTSPVFQQEMGNVEYKKSGVSVWQKFKQVILDILGAVYPTVKTDSMAQAAILESINFINEEYQMRRQNEIQKVLPHDINYHLEMDDSNKLLYGALDTSNEVDTTPTDETENEEDNMIENSLFDEDVLNLPDCL